MPPPATADPPPARSHPPAPRSEPPTARPPAERRRERHDSTAHRMPDALSNRCGFSTLAYLAEFIDCGDSGIGCDESSSARRRALDPGPAKPDGDLQQGAMHDMKRILLAVLAGLTMTGAVAGAASVLTVDGGVMQSGVDPDLTCDADGVYLSSAPAHPGGIMSAQTDRKNVG